MKKVMCTLVLIVLLALPTQRHAKDLVVNIIRERQRSSDKLVNKYVPRLTSQPQGSMSKVVANLIDAIFDLTLLHAADLDDATIGKLDQFAVLRESTPTFSAQSSPRAGQLVALRRAKHILSAPSSHGAGWQQFRLAATTHNSSVPDVMSQYPQEVRQVGPIATSIDSLRESFGRVLSLPMHKWHKFTQISPTQVTLLSAIVNVLLSTFKIGVGSVAGSAALVADGAHSFSDLVSDAFCGLAVQFGSRPADASHPNGYGHYEHIGSLGIAVILIFTGMAMVMQSGAAFISTIGSAAAPRVALEVVSLLVAAASVASKELLYRLSYAVGTNHASPSTVANAYHHRSDALSSLVAIVGIGGAMFGCRWLDPLAATTVGLMVAVTGVEIAHESALTLAQFFAQSSNDGLLGA